MNFFKVKDYLTNFVNIFIQKENENKFALAFGLILFSVLLEGLNVSFIFFAARGFIDPELSANIQPFEGLLRDFGLAELGQYAAYLFFLAIPAVYIAKNLLLYRINVFLVKVATQVQDNIGKQLFSAYVSQRFAKFEKSHSSELLRNIVTECGHVSTLIEASLYLLTEILVITLLGGVLLFLNPYIGLTLIFFVFLYALTYYFLFWERLKSIGITRQRVEGQRLRIIKETVQCIREIKMFTKESFFFELFSKFHSSHTLTIAETKILSQMPRYLIEVFMVLMGTFAVFVVIVSSKSNAEIVAIFSVFGGSMLRIAPSINRINSCYTTLRLYHPVLQVLSTKIFPDQDEVQNLSKPVIERENNEWTAFESLEVKNLYFNHQNRASDIVRGANLKINKGDFIGIIGQSGCGKSTLLDILTGLILPKEGVRELNGRDIGFHNINDKAKFGYVPQKTFLLDDTIAANVAFGEKPDEIDTDRVIEILEHVSLMPLVKTLRGGINAIVGEDGGFLSGGQNQRLNIARMLYADAEIIILDEATSALDTEIEERLLSDLCRIRGEKPVICVTHRESALKYCNKVFELHDGLLKPIQVSSP